MISARCGLSGAKRRVEQLNARMTANIDVDLSGGTYDVPGGLGFLDTATFGTARVVLPCAPRW